MDMDIRHFFDIGPPGPKDLSYEVSAAPSTQ